MILLADIKGPDKTSRMCRLIWSFAVLIYPKKRFGMARFVLCLVTKMVSKRTISILSEQIIVWDNYLSKHKSWFVSSKTCEN